MILLLNQTEPDNGGVFGSIGKERGGGRYSSIPGGYKTKFLQSQTAGLLAGREARRNLGSNGLLVKCSPLLSALNPLMASRSCSSPDFGFHLLNKLRRGGKKDFLCTEI